MRRLKFTLLLLFLVGSVLAQQKPSLVHEDYDRWNSLSSVQLSKDGQWVGYEISPQEGDGRIEVANHDQPASKIIIPRGAHLSFSHNNKWAVGKINAEYDTVRMLKLKGKKSKDLPKDSLFILSLASGTIETIPQVKSFKTPKKSGDWLAILMEKTKEKKDTTAADSTKKAVLKTDGTDLIVRTYDGMTNYTLSRVDEYGFSENGQKLFYVLASQDTLENAALGIMDLETGEQQLLDSGKTKYSQVSLSRNGKALAYLATADSAKSKKPYYTLYAYSSKKNEISELPESQKKALMEDSRISENGSLSFSYDEERLFFEVSDDYKTFDYEEDSTILEDERVSLDIWGWQDAEIQPMQLLNKDKESKKGYLAVMDLKNGKVTQLEDKTVTSIRLDPKRKLEVAYGTDDNPYRINYSWDIQVGRDVYWVDLKSGDKKLVAKEVQGYPELSPAGKFLTWYSYPDSAWIAYDAKSSSLINLTAAIEDNFYDQIHDSPSMPRSYGSAGWTEGDEEFLVYSQYDIWKIDPSSPDKAVNITLGSGNREETSYRVEDLDEELEYINAKAPLILSAFNDKTKKSGYFKGDLEAKSAPVSLVYSDHQYFELLKAEESEAIVLRRSTFEEYPEVYVGDMGFENLEKVSETNPQQAEVNWGTVELTEYVTLKGDSLQGLIYKPEDFDASKKYPLMVYFYERSSDRLHRYISPSPSASTINISYFVSNGYVVFVPDIKYDIGHPGKSAYDCIVPGVLSVAEKGYIDTDNMAIQGQSWGGYQVAYLITQTDMFKAAGSGAPVANMTSAYGGIRWGTGMSRMFQYEQTQSRIGGTLWEKPMEYIENSPLFYADQVHTPVLIMHNDEDGAVPWYQGIEFFMALKRNRTPAWLLVYNGEDHNLRLRKNRKDLSIRLSQFFDYYLKGAPAPLWMTEGLPAVEKGRTLKYELSE
ncbi:S9 family peptidase [Echinicola pacifica]|uniref:S9 family peptidase n=1 Tax=Echinicola pacifica TaxID=346377 RepID=UPI00037833B3|nr:prolyl oligopeptidase family serine peptidase [Echinicola pacifica]